MTSVPPASPYDATLPGSPGAVYSAREPGQEQR